MILLLFGAIIVCVPVALAIHELAHVLVAVAVGFRVYKLELGIGEPLIRFQMFGTLVSIGWRPGGRVWTSPRKLDGWNWRRALIAFSGPAMNGVAAVTAIIVGMNVEGNETARTVIAVFAAVNLFYSLSLAPGSPADFSGTQRRSDGDNLLQALHASPDKVRELTLAAWANELEVLAETESRSLTVLAQQFVSLAPERPDGLFMLGAALMEDGEFDAAQEKFRAGLAVLGDTAINDEARRQVFDEIQLIIDECAAHVSCESESVS